MTYFLHPAGYSYESGWLWDVGRDLERDIEGNDFESKEEAIKWGVEFIKNNLSRFDTEGFNPGEHYELEVCEWDPEKKKYRDIVDWLVIKEHSVMLYSTRGDLISLEEERKALEKEKASDPLRECKCCCYFQQTEEPEWKGKFHCTWQASDYDNIAPCDYDEVTEGGGDYAEV